MTARREAPTDTYVRMLENTKYDVNEYIIGKRQT